MSKPAVPTEAEHQAQFDKIVDPVRIGNILRRLFQAHALLTVGLPDAPRLYNTAIIALLPEENALLLDELHPRQGHERVSAGTPLRIHGRVKDTEVSFTGPVESIGTGRETGIAYYRLALPAQLYHQQRRKFYRAKVGLARQVEVTLAMELGPAELHDISLGGVRVRLPEASRDTLQPGTRFENCQIALPDGRKPLSCTLEIRHVQMAPDGKQWLVGCRFLGLAPRAEQRVQRFVVQLDRELRKKGSRGA